MVPNSGLIEVTEPDGRETQYEFDSSGIKVFRIVSVIYEDDSSTTVYFRFLDEKGSLVITFSHAGTVVSRFYTPLEKEDWYYHFYFKSYR